MSDLHPTTPPDSGPAQTEATPAALAARWERVAGDMTSIRGNEHIAGAAQQARICASQLRELAPAWDAVAAENARLREEIGRLLEAIGTEGLGEADAEIDRLQHAQDDLMAVLRDAERDRDAAREKVATLDGEKLTLIAALANTTTDRDTWKAAHDSREAECTGLRRLRAEDREKHRTELAARPVALPNVHADSQEEAEAWMAAEYESVGDSHAMRDAYEAGWDRYRELARKALEARNG